KQVHPAAGTVARRPAEAAAHSAAGVMGHYLAAMRCSGVAAARAAAVSVAPERCLFSPRDLEGQWRSDRAPGVAALLSPARESSRWWHSVTAPHAAAAERCAAPERA